MAGQVAKIIKPGSGARLNRVLDHTGSDHLRCAMDANLRAAPDDPNLCYSIPSDTADGATNDAVGQPSHAQYLFTP